MSASAPKTTSSAPQVSPNSAYSKYNNASAPASQAMSAQPGGLLLPVGQPGAMLAISGGLLPIDHFRLKLYNYAMAERLRSGYPPPPPGMPLCPQPLSAVGGDSPAQRVAAAAMMGQYGPGLALSMSLFQNRMFSSAAEEPKPQHSYIGLIAIAILGSPEMKMVLSDIYQHILDNYPYFRSRGPGWRNSIRHNLSLNDCFVKAGRSANGKGHYWAIHPANVEDFKKGDFRRRKAQRKVRKHMGLAVDDAGTDSPSPPPIADPFTSPWQMPHVPGMDLNLIGGGGGAALYHPPANAHFPATAVVHAGHPQFAGDPFLLQRHQQHLQMITSKLSCSRKRQFDVASLLAPDDQQHHHHHHQQESNEALDQTTTTSPATILQSQSGSSDADAEENIDVEANEEAEEDSEEDGPELHSYFSNSAGSNNKFEVQRECPLKRRRLLVSGEEPEERSKFPWPAVHKALPVGSLLERYYAAGQAGQTELGLAKKCSESGV